MNDDLDAQQVEEEHGAVGGDDERYEVKFVCDLDQLASVESWILESGALFRREYPDRVVNSIYYDTIDYECLRTNLIGVGQRYKARLRWYGTTHEPEALTLEYKIRRGRVGSKSRHSIEGGALEDTEVSEIRRRLLDVVSPEQARMAGDFHAPVLRLAYLRSYYISLDRKVRLTIDRRQEFFDMRRARNVVQREGRHPYPYYVIEFKAERDEVALLSKTVKDFPLSIMRNSKYLIGASTLLRVPYI